MIHTTLKKNVKVVVGSVRQSQLITTFGTGAMVDFVDHTVIMSGIDDWDWANQEEFQVFNQNLQNLLDVQYFVKPKLSTKSNMWDKGSADIPASIFPTMLYCPTCKSIVSASSVTPDQYRHKFFCRADGCPAGGKSQLVPSRFVLVCPDGHIEDFPYYWWVHNGPGEKYQCTCEKKHPTVKMFYTRNRTDLDSLMLECECGAKRSMKNASGVNAFADYHCSGKRPWLADHEECNADKEHRYMQMRVRSESSVFFSSTVSALTIPPWSTKIAQEIQKIYSFLGPDLDNKELIIRKVKSKFPSVQEEVILDIYNKIQSGKDKKTSMQEIIEDEYIAMISGLDNGDDFISHSEDVPARYNHIIEKVVALDRLTVVTAMNGFKRLTAPTGYNDETLSKITKKERPFWLPGIEQRGEGMFIQFNQDILDAWTRKNGEHYNNMKNKLEDSYFGSEDNKGKFSPQYVFLHTFAHLFIRELSHLCGYSAASIKERIYSTYEGSNRKMAGILVYTSTADADGSLGGLVEQAKTINIEKIIASMVERGKWCSADPVCYTSQDQGNLSLNYAACFACTLLPETSCEFFNVLLDRCAVCGKPDNTELGLMNWSK